MRFSVVVAAYNEEATVGDAIAGLLQCGFIDEIVFVDDGSTDRTAAVVRESADRFPRRKQDLVCITLPENSGKGAALRRGIARASGDIIAFFDADREYDPADFQPMLDQIHDGADVVYGSRFIGPRREVGTWRHFMVNAFLTLCTNILFNVRLSDMETCLKMFRRPVLDGWEFRSRGFDIEPELTAAACRGGRRIAEVPISYRPRTYAEGKKIKWYHGFQALWALVKFRLRRK